MIFKTSEPYVFTEWSCGAKNCALMDRVRSIMHCIDMSNKLWAKAVGTASHTRNSTLSAVVDWKAPWETWDSKASNINHLRSFGYHVEVFEPKVYSNKLDTRARECLFLGYTIKKRIYQFYDTTTGKIFVSKNAKFFKLEKFLLENFIYRKDRLVFDDHVDNVDDDVGWNINQKNISISVQPCWSKLFDNWSHGSRVHR